ncbi:hypothetical protein CGK45_22475 [Vibrio parahaemolyticus]|uniref:hypothetical protein n=1 Tax=Vibrio parahaemolyticus TaxID=670 RepID=UPI001124B2ED|nr:hypothetical protein [Vibrio parahaemolyticus]TNZ55831.1 hypothetical protein CGK45_22475 [Vibrio parahaemolyticus]
MFEIELSQVALIVGVFVNLIGSTLVVHKIKNLRGEKASGLHERYTKIKELSLDMDSNYPEILVILSGITSRTLSKDEVIWFLHQPGAFLKLKRYGYVAGRYCEIDLDKSEFALTERVSTTKKQLIEISKILGVSFLLLIIISGVWYLTVNNVGTESSVYIASGFWLLYFLCITWGVGFVFTTLSRAKGLVSEQKIVNKAFKTDSQRSATLV